MEGVSSATSLTQSATTPTPSSRPQAAEAQQASQAEAAQRSEEAARQSEQRPPPVVNEQGQTTGTIINDTA